MINRSQNSLLDAFVTNYVSRNAREEEPIVMVISSFDTSARRQSVGPVVGARRDVVKAI